MYQISNRYIRLINKPTISVCLILKNGSNAIIKKHSDNYYAAANKSKKLFHSASFFVLCSKIRLCISSNLFNYEFLRKYYVRYPIYVGITYAFAILLGQSCIPLLCSLLFKDVSTMDVLL